jgi:endonuclease III
MRKPNIRTKRRVVRALRLCTRSMEWGQWRRGTTKLHALRANAFLLGVMFDFGVRAGSAWDKARDLCLRLGGRRDVTRLWKRLAAMDGRRLRGLLHHGYDGQAYHRFHPVLARRLPAAAAHILSEYGGDPRRIWNGQRDVPTVRRRLDAIPGVGAQLASMAAFILARDYGLLGGRSGKADHDVKVDVHVRRVFRRTGLVGPRCPDSAVRDAARALSPRSPAALDPPAWHIGQQWCRPTRPKCDECKIGDVCPRVGLWR